MNSDWNTKESTQVHVVDALAAGLLETEETDGCAATAATGYKVRKKSKEYIGLLPAPFINADIQQVFGNYLQAFQSFRTRSQEGGLSFENKKQPASPDVEKENPNVDQ